MPANPFEGLTVDRIGTDVILRFGDEAAAEEARDGLEKVLPLLAALGEFLNNGGHFGDL